MEFKRSEVTVTIYGEAIKAKLPTFKESVEYRKSWLACGDDSEAQTECLLDFIDKTVGIPRKVIEGMEADHVEQLVEMLLVKKKQKPSTIS